MRDSVTQKMNLNFLFVNIDFVEAKHSHIHKIEKKTRKKEKKRDKFLTAVSQFAL